MNVTVVHLAEKDLKFLLKISTEAISPNTAGDWVGSIRFKGGLEIPADLVVMAAGIKPNTALAESADLHCQSGLVVNDTTQTFDTRVYAVGECASH